MKRLLILMAIASVAGAQYVHADQLLYDPHGTPIAYLSTTDGSLHLLKNGGIFAYLEGDTLFDHKDVHSIGYLKGNCLYENDGTVLGYLKKKR